MFVLSESDVLVLRDIIAKYRAGNLGRPKLATPGIPPRSNVLFGVPDATITGTTGQVTDPGSGTLSVYNFTSTGGTSDTGQDITAYNLRSTDATTDHYAICSRDYQSGNWVIAPIPSLIPNPCSDCSVTPNTINATISGFGDSACTNCSAVDGTYALDHSTNPATPCLWFKEFDVSLGACGTKTMALELTSAFGVWTMNLKEGSIGGVIRVTWASGIISTPMDCTANRTLTLQSDVWADCDTAANATIN